MAIETHLGLDRVAPGSAAVLVHGPGESDQDGGEEEDPENGAQSSNHRGGYRLNRSNRYDTRHVS
ncbi:MAG TPA: hypothetical protein VMS56_03940 [Thermoanaerobaculia bacterium]|nr:hypothetical protein [Thermoanaerobaculia bacterium]